MNRIRFQHKILEIQIPTYLKEVTAVVWEQKPHGLNSTEDPWCHEIEWSDIILCGGGQVIYVEATRWIIWRRPDQIFLLHSIPWYEWSSIEFNHTTHLS